MNVLGGRIEKICVDRRICLQLSEPADYRVEFFSGYQPGPIQAACVRDASANVSREQAPIEPERIVKLGKCLVRLLGKAAAPKFFVTHLDQIQRLKRANIARPIANKTSPATVIQNPYSSSNMSALKFIPRIPAITATEPVIRVRNVSRWTRMLVR